MNVGLRRLKHTWQSMLLLVCGLLLPGGMAAQELAITFDDLPAHSALPPGQTRVGIAGAIVHALQSARVPPTYGFVNGIRFTDTGEAAAVLKLWRDAGNPLGSHTYSHMDLAKNSLESWEKDVLRDESFLREASRPGDDWHWLRFPYLSEGNTEEKRKDARAFLLQHGYRIAAVTMSFGDYAWNEPYARCVAQGDQQAVRKLEATYLEAAQEDARYRRALAHAALGRDIPYVLLMHLGALDAQMLPKLLAMYGSEGFHFVSMEHAEQDPFYANDLHLQLGSQPDTLEAAAKSKGVTEWPKHHGPPPELETICR